MMYSVIELSTGNFQGRVKVQDGIETHEWITKEEAIDWVVLSAKELNHDDIAVESILFEPHIPHEKCSDGAADGASPRTHALTVVLDGSLPDEEAKAVIDAIKMIRNVIGVREHVVDHNAYWARKNLTHYFGEKVITAIHPDKKVRQEISGRLYDALQKIAPF